MSQLGNISKSYGKSFAFAIANANDSQILSAKNLPANTLIISSPTKNGKDIGFHSIFATDYNGVPVQLSYNIILDNCFVKDKDDNIYIDIDNTSIVDNNGLDIKLSNIIDNRTVINKNGKISVNIAALPYASEDTYGIVKYDNHTIKRNNIGELYVETSNMEIASNDNYGICTCDNITNVINNDILSVNTQNLELATYNAPGLVKGGDDTIIVNNGLVSINNDKLPLASENNYGVSMPDNITIIQKDDKYVAKCNEVATDTTFGIVQPDFKTTFVKNGVLSIYDGEELENNIDYIDKQLTIYKNQLENIIVDNYIDKKHSINKIEPINRSGCVLTKCIYGVFPDMMKTELISCEYLINTSCPFNITINILQNVSPQIYINKIIYDGTEFYGSNWKTNEFPSTHNIDKKLSIEFACKNYANSSSNTETTITNAIISIICSKDNDVKLETRFGIIRYNSLYYGGMIEKPTLNVNTDGSITLKQSDLLVNEKQLLIYDKSLENSNIYSNYSKILKNKDVIQGKSINK